MAVHPNLEEKNWRYWRIIYFLGSGAALLALLVFRRNCGVEFIEFDGFGIWQVPDAWPVTAMDWMTLYQESIFTTLVLYNFIDVINYILVGLVFLACYGALRSESKNIMRMAVILAAAGIVVYIFASQTLTMAILGGRYGAAATEAEMINILTRITGILAINNPGEIFPGWGVLLGLSLVALAGLLISIVMLRSPLFGKVCALCGILANFFVFTYFLALLIAPSFVWVMALSAPFRIIWYLLIAIKLLQLAAGKTTVVTSN